jgi:hypothetical protein
VGANNLSSIVTQMSGQAQIHNRWITDLGCYRIDHIVPHITNNVMCLCFLYYRRMMAVCCVSPQCCTSRLQLDSHAPNKLEPMISQRAKFHL